MNEIQKKFERIDQLNFDDVVKSHRAEQWSFACKLSQSLSIFRMILRKFIKYVALIFVLWKLFIYFISRAMETCNPDSLRHLASSYHDLLTHEKSLDFLVDLLQKDQLHNSLSLNTLDKTISFYEVFIDVWFYFR
jgi:dynactin 1